MSATDLTLDSANSMLEQIGIDQRFTPALLDAATRGHAVARVRDALRKAPTDTGARRFVENLLQGAHAAPSANSTGRQKQGRSASAGSPSKRSAPQQAPSAPKRSRQDSARCDSSEAIDQRTLPLTFKVFGRKGALEFREHRATKGYDTVMLEGAAAIGERQYDWRNKISVQMMPRELPSVAAVLGGLLPKCEFQNHGPEKNKGYSIENQRGAFFVRVYVAGDKHALHAVPMPPEESYYINALVLRQLARAVPGLDGFLVASAVRSYARATGNG